MTGDVENYRRAEVGKKISLVARNPGGERRGPLRRAAFAFGASPPLVVRVNDLSVSVAANKARAYAKRHQLLDGLVGQGTGRDVAADHDCLDPFSTDFGQHRPQRGQIAVDVR